MKRLDPERFASDEEGEGAPSRVDEYQLGGRESPQQYSTATSSLRPSRSSLLPLKTPTSTASSSSAPSPSHVDLTAASAAEASPRGGRDHGESPPNSVAALLQDLARHRPRRKDEPKTPRERKDKHRDKERNKEGDGDRMAMSADGEVLVSKGRKKRSGRSMIYIVQQPGVVREEIFPRRRETRETAVLASPRRTSTPSTSSDDSPSTPPPSIAAFMNRRHKSRDKDGSSDMDLLPASDRQDAEGREAERMRSRHYKDKSSSNEGTSSGEHRRSGSLIITPRHRSASVGGSAAAASSSTPKESQRSSLKKSDSKSDSIQGSDLIRQAADDTGDGRNPDRKEKAKRKEKDDRDRKDRGERESRHQDSSNNQSDEQGSTSQSSTPRRHKARDRSSPQKDEQHSELDAQPSPVHSSNPNTPPLLSGAAFLMQLSPLTVLERKHKRHHPQSDGFEVIPRSRSSDDANVEDSELSSSSTRSRRERRPSQTRTKPLRLDKSWGALDASDSFNFDNDEDLEEWERSAPRSPDESPEKVVGDNLAERSKHRSRQYDERGTSQSPKKSKELHSPPRPDYETRESAVTLGSPDLTSRRHRKSGVRRRPSILDSESTTFIASGGGTTSESAEPSVNVISSEEAPAMSTGSLSKEDAAIVLQKMFRGSLGRRQGRKQALLTAWELLDYDDERKTIKQTQRAHKLESMVRDSLREIQLKEFFKHKVKQDLDDSDVESEVEVDPGLEITEDDPTDNTKTDRDQERQKDQKNRESKSKHQDPSERRRESESKKRKEESDKDRKARKQRKRKKNITYFKIDLQPHQPITSKIVTKLINRFKDGEVLDERDATEILRQMKEWYYKHGQALVDLDVPEGTVLTVCGDVHGQLDDLLTIFRLNGLPADNSIYIFNGDLVDRGRYGIEICLLLFALKLSHDSTVHINRGNHECRRMNERYSFEKEVLQKYDDRMFDRIQKVFNQLPIATLIRNKIFITHGGLFRESDLTIEEIRQMNFRQDIPLKAEDRISQAFIDLMWSDPRPHTGIEPSRRGAGAYFGPDITAAFMEKNGLELVIRSHEMVPWGYSVAHDHKMITVFSASSYCGTNDNFGAYLSLRSDLVPTFHRFQADSLKNISRTFSAEELKTETTRKLRERIFENRYNLAVAFAQADPELTGKITRIQWAQIMGETLQLPSMPWLSLQPMLAKASKDRNNVKVIKYKHFLARYQVLLNHQLVDSWQDLLVREICQKLYDSGENLNEEFKKIDSEGTGLVAKDAFVKTIRNLRVGFGDLELQSLLASCITQDNQVNYREWIKKLHTVYTELEYAHRETEDWIELAIQEIGMEIVKHKESMNDLFSQFDEDRDGELSFKEFERLLKHLGFGSKYNKLQKERIIRFISKQSHTEGNLSRSDFVQALKVDMDDMVWKERVIQHMCYVFFKNRYELLTVFRSFNTSGSGVIDQQEFKAGMKTLKKLLNINLSSVQLEKLYEVIDADQDGFISMNDFMDAFQVVDVEQEKRRRQSAQQPSP